MNANLRECWNELTLTFDPLPQERKPTYPRMNTSLRHLTLSLSPSEAERERAENNL
jgi:hypothetical protein